jgi:heme exporter protein B
MSSLSRIRALIRKEFLLEWKQKYAVAGVLLYAFTMVFVVSLAFLGNMELKTWNILFWILLLFVSVNAIARSFIGESRETINYVYSLAGPSEVLAAKLIFNCLVMTGITLLTFFFLLVMSKISVPVSESPPRPDLPQFSFLVLISGWGVTANLTLVSALASQAKNSATLMAVLGFPLLIPQLLVSISAGQNALLGLPWSESSGYLLFSGMFFGIIALLSLILFPFLWKE